MILTTNGTERHGNTGNVIYDNIDNLRGNQCSCHAQGKIRYFEKTSVMDSKSLKEY